jgi:hypothetical protein
MIRVAVVVLTIVSLSGCAHKMAECHGPVFPMNAGLWLPTPEDLK